MGGTELRTTPVDERRDEIAARVERARGLVVGLDFDGTLVPTADDPGTGEVDPDSRAALGDLAARPDVAVTVVSGRELSDLKSRVGVRGVVYAGNHGLELERDGAEVVHPIATRRRPLLREAVESIEDRVGDVPGCEIEDRGFTVTVRHRRAAREDVDGIRSGVEAVVSGGDDGLQVTHGEGVTEVRPAIDWDEGSVLLYVAEHVSGDWSVLYLGGDATAEAAFRVVGDGGVGVVVGSRADTLADYRLDSQDDVGPFLTWLATTVAGRKH